MKPWITFAFKYRWWELLLCLVEVKGSSQKAGFSIFSVSQCLAGKSLIPRGKHEKLSVLLDVAVHVEHLWFVTFGIELNQIKIRPWLRRYQCEILERLCVWRVIYTSIRDVTYHDRVDLAERKGINSLTTCMAADQNVWSPSRYPTGALASCFLFVCRLQ